MLTLSKMQSKKRNQFAQRHSKLVHKIVHRIKSSCNEPYEDLYQIGFIGLLKAVDRFNPELKNAFSSFAVPYIEGEIRHYLRDQVPRVKLPRSAIEKFGQVKRLRKHFISLGREVNEQEIAKKIGLSQEQWDFIMSVNNRQITLSFDELPYEPAVSSSEETNYEEVYGCLSQLSATQRYVLIQRYFLGKSYADISKDMKLSSTSVEAIATESIALLNSSLSEIYAA